MAIHSRLKVLVAEDDPVFRRLLQFTLERVGHTVFCVADGEEAWNRLQQGDIDLLVTDHQMPLCSGIDLLKRILASNNDSPTSSSSSSDSLVSGSILCTAKGLELDRRSLKEHLGLVDVIGKPFSPKKLVKVIADHFGLSESSNGKAESPQRGTWRIGLTG